MTNITILWLMAVDVLLHAHYPFLLVGAEVALLFETIENPVKQPNCFVVLFTFFNQLNYGAVCLKFIHDADSY